MQPHNHTHILSKPQVMVPGNPKLSLTTTWALSYDPLGDWAPDTPFVRALQLFLRGDDAERGNIFKLIPRCAFPSLHACFVPAIHLQGIGLGSRPDGLRAFKLSMALPLRGDDSERSNCCKLVSRRLAQLSSRNDSGRLVCLTHLRLLLCIHCSAPAPVLLNAAAPWMRNISLYVCASCRVEKGSWIVKQAVGQNTPVLLGKKLTTKYFRGPNYVEVHCCAKPVICTLMGYVVQKVALLELEKAEHFVWPRGPPPHSRAFTIVLLLAVAALHPKPLRLSKQ